MNSKLKIVLIVFSCVLALAIIVVAATLVSRSAQKEPAVTAAPTPVQTAEPTSTPEPTPAETVTATIAIGGDVVMHTGLNTEALKSDGTYDYTPVFGIIGGDIAGADYAVCSLVTTFNGGTDYSAYPLFRSPVSLAASLKTVGFDLVNTATSHAADSYKTGIDKTLDTLDAAGLAHVGTYRTAEERAAGSGVTLADINGISVAFLSYTCDTNQIPVAGFEYAVNVCASDYLSGGTTIDYDLIDTDMAVARESGADFIFVFMSWGKELDTAPNETQTTLADHLFQQGADVIIGGHTRVPQLMEARKVTDIDGNEKTGYVCYSLGNLLSCQNDANTDISAIVKIELTKGVDVDRAWISSAGYEPIYMVDLYDYGINDYGWHYRLADLHAAIDAYDAGAPWEFVNADVYGDMTSALGKLHEFMGVELDSGSSGGD